MKVIQLCPSLCGLHNPWNSPGQNTGVGSLSLLHRIFPTQGSNPGLQHCRRILYQLSHQGSPRILEWVAYPFSSGSSQPRNPTVVSCTAGGFFTSWGIREAPYSQWPPPKFLNDNMLQVKLITLLPYLKCFYLFPCIFVESQIHNMLVFKAPSDLALPLSPVSFCITFTFTVYNPGTLVCCQLLIWAENSSPPQGICSC